MSKSNKLIISISLLLVVAITASIIGYLFIAQPSYKADDTLSTEILNGEYVSLESSPAFASEGGLVSKTITATVLPENADNKNTSWSMAWESSRSENVNDYLTIVPSGANNNTLTITCKKVFPANIIITCTTEQFEYTACCKVKYVGIPTTISASGNEDIKIMNGYLIMPNTKKLTWTINLNNPYNQVDNSYLNNLDVKLTGTGRFNTVDRYGNLYNDTITETNPSYVDCASVVNKLCSVKVVGNQITLTCDKDLKKYYKQRITHVTDPARVPEDGGYLDLGAFKSYDDASEGVFIINVKVPNTQVSLDIPFFYYLEGADSVKLSGNEVVF